MKPKFIAPALAAALSVTLTAAALAQAAPPPANEVGLAQLALNTLPAKGNAKLVVTTPAFAAGADIPMANTQYQGNAFPGLLWTAGPANTQSYVIIMQDTDGVRQGVPFLHWTMYNIPSSILKLDPGSTVPPAGASNGPNYQGPNRFYLGPRTPPGPKHRYHIQVFALDTTIPADPAATYASITAAMKDHVLASGEIIGLGQAPPP